MRSTERTGDEAKRDRHWMWLTLYAVLTVVLLAPLSLEFDRRLPDDGDAPQNLWIIWWGASHLHLGYPDVYNANGYYPHRWGLVYSEPQFSQALLGWPLFNGLENRVLAYNLLVAVSLFLSAFAAHLLFRELTGSAVAASVGAVVFAFSCYSFSQLARSQLVSLQWFPLALLCLHCFFDRDRKSYLVGFFAFSVLLGLACFYYLQFYLIALFVIVPAYLWAYRSWRRPASVAWLGASFVLVAIPLFAAAAPYFDLFDRYEFVGHPGSYDLVGFFRPPGGSLMYGGFGLPIHSMDQFLGYIALGLGGFGLVSFLRTRRRRQARAVGLAYALLGGMSFLLAGGPDIVVNGARLLPGPYRILQLIGPLGNLRDPYRFSVLTRLALALFVAAGAAALLARGRTRVKTLGSALLSGLILAEQWSPRYTRGTEIPVGNKIPEAYAALEAYPGNGPVAELPMRPFRGIRFNTLEAYFSTFHRRPILVGKPSFPPPAYDLLRWELGSFPDRKSIILLQSLGVELVLVHPKRWGELRAPYSRDLARRNKDLPLLEKFPDREDPLWNRYELGAEQLHEVAALEREGSPRLCDCREIDRRTLRLAANGRNDPALAIDGDRTTKWTTGGYQQKGFFFEIAFDRPRRPVRVEIEMAFPYREFARHLEVNGFRGQRFWRMKRIEDVWYTVELIRQLVEDPSRARLRYDFEPMEVDRLRMFLLPTEEQERTEEGAGGWSIPELHVYDLDEGPGP